VLCYSSGLGTRPLSRPLAPVPDRPPPVPDSIENVGLDGRGYLSVCGTCDALEDQAISTSAGVTELLTRVVDQYEAGETAPRIPTYVACRGLSLVAGHADAHKTWANYQNMVICTQLFTILHNSTQL
jgi:hypothetical protein